MVTTPGAASGVTGGLRWMFHATAMAASYEDVVAPLQRLFGCRVLHDNEVPTPGIERRGGMTWIGDNSIEIGEPLGETSPVRRFLERFGGGMHSVAVQVDDVEAALERARSFGVRTADRPQPGVAFTRPGDTAGLLFEWFGNPQGDDPRWGHALPPFTVEPLVDVRHFAFVGAIVEDPAAAAEHLGRVLDTRVTTFGDGGPPDSPRSGVDLGDCTLALYAMPSPSASKAVWGQVHDRPRCLAMGLVVDDLGAAEAVLAAESHRVHHRTGDGHLVLDPSRLPFPIVLTDRLLPGDPRKTT